MLLINTIFPIMGYDKEPPWVAQLLETFGKQQDVLLYNPRLSLERNNKLNQGRFLDVLNEKMPLPPEGERIFETLQLDPSLVEPGDNLQQLFNDNGRSSSIIFRDLFLLLRSFLIVMDANNPYMGGESAQIVYAHLLHKPVIVISDLHVTGPWYAGHAEAIVTSELASKQVAVQLMAQQKAQENTTKQAQTPTDGG